MSSTNLERCDLKAARARANLTQAELASKAAVHVNAYSRIELGQSDPLLSTARRVARVLGRPLDELFPDTASDAAPAAGTPNACNPQ